jgi:two-component system, LytTR family, sensor kinase
MDPIVSPSDSPPRIRWRWIVGLFAAAFVARFAYFYFDDLSRHMGGTFERRLLEEFTGNLASFLFFPIAIIAERRFPLDRGRWRRNWWAHVCAFVAYSILHTTFLALSRKVLFPVFGLGRYDYGAMSVRYLMEAGQDAISYVTFAGLLTLLRVQGRLRERETRELQLEHAATRAQVEVLTLRLQPHFLFNALNTISSVVYEDPAVADELIGRLGELLRRSMDASARQETSLAEELDLLEAYAALIEARFGDRVRFVNEIDESTRACAVPVFLLQPLVENAVKHGSLLERSSTTIVIRASLQGDQVELTVENDVNAQLVEPRKKGMGLGGTTDRLRLLYGDAASLTASAADGKFRVIVRIPAREMGASGFLLEPSSARADR